MNKRNIQTRGFGLILTIVILAILSLGGYTAIKYSEKHQEEKAMRANDATLILESKTKVKEGLTTIKANLNSNMAIKDKITVSTKILANLKTELAEAKVSASADVQAEISDIQDSLDELELQIKANTNKAKDSVSDFIDEVDVSLEANTQNQMLKSTTNSDTMMQNDSVDENTEMQLDNSMMKSNSSMQATSSLLKINADMNVMSDTNI